jgi:uncharacterized protein YdaU (DUF1376 family)
MTNWPLYNKYVRDMVRDLIKTSKPYKGMFCILLFAFTTKNKRLPTEPEVLRLLASLYKEMIAYYSGKY